MFEYAVILKDLPTEVPKKSATEDPEPLHYWGLTIIIYVNYKAPPSFRQPYPIVGPHPRAFLIIKNIFIYLFFRFTIFILFLCFLCHSAATSCIA